MNRLLLLLLFVTTIFANSLEDRIKKLEERVSILEQKLNSVHKSQQNIVEAETINSCSKILLKNYHIDFLNLGFIKKYRFNYLLENNYKYGIKYIYATINFYNKDAELLENVIKRDIKLSSKKTANIETYYLINDTLSESLHNIPSNQIRVEFKPIKIVFDNNRVVKCR